MIQYLTVIFLLLTANNCFSASADTARNGAETTSQVSLTGSNNRDMPPAYSENNSLFKLVFNFKKDLKNNSCFTLITNAETVKIDKHEEESIMIEETFMTNERTERNETFFQGLFFNSEISLSAITDRQPNETLEYKITLPTSTDVTVTTVDRSDVFITGVASVKLLHDAGTIKVKNVPGKVKIRKSKTGFIFINNCPNSEDVIGTLSTIERE